MLLIIDLILIGVGVFLQKKKTSKKINLSYIYKQSKAFFYHNRFYPRTLLYVTKTLSTL